MTKRYVMPEFLAGISDQIRYERWLRRKGAACLIRDRKRGNEVATGETYRLAIHQAVIQSGGRDFYTGEVLRWDLISTYDNDQSKAGGRVYKAEFGLLPSVDHFGDGMCAGDFRICGWRTNDAKNDLNHAEFVELCRRVVAYHGKLEDAAL